MTPGELSAVGFAGGVGREVGGNVTYPALAGYVNAVGYAATFAYEHVEVPPTGEVNAVGYAPTLGVTYNAQPSVGVVDAVGYAANVSANATRTITPAAGSIEAFGFAGTLTRFGGFGQPGIVDAVSAAVGPTVEIIRRVSGMTAGEGSAVGYASTIDFAIGGNITLTAQLGVVDAVGYAATLDELPQPLVTPNTGFADAVGYAASVEPLGVQYRPQVGRIAAETSSETPTVELWRDIEGPDTGVIDAVGYAASVEAVAPISYDIIPQTGRVNAVGYRSASLINATAESGLVHLVGYAPIILIGQYVIETGSADAVTAQVGPTVEIVRLIPGMERGEADAVGFEGIITSRIGDNLTIGAPAGNAISAVGYEPTIDLGVDLIISPLVGTAEAVGFAGSAEKAYFVNGQVGIIQAADTGESATVELWRDIEGPDTGSAGAVGFAADTQTLTPNITNVNAVKGDADAVGYEPTVTWTKNVQAQTGTVDAVGYVPETLYEPGTANVDVVGYAPTVTYERLARPQLGVVNADGSIADVTIFRGTYERIGETGEVEAIGLAHVIQILGRPEIRRDDGAGSGGRRYDDTLAQIRAEDELILQVITEFIKRVA
jgi:hypothetical protein